MPRPPNLTPSNNTGKCPTLDAYTDTSTAGLPSMSPPNQLTQVLNAVLFLHLTKHKSYPARSRAFLYSLGTLDEDAIVQTLKNPQKAISEAEKQAEQAREQHAAMNSTLRKVGIGLGAVAGGVLVGVTGGLAAPLVGAGVSAVLGFVGVGGTAAGLLASGLAGSSVVCGALFGAYGARSTALMVDRHTKDVQDLAIKPVRTREVDTLAVRLCVSGWLSQPEDVTAPWTVFGDDADTFALRWVT